MENIFAMKVADAYRKSAPSPLTNGRSSVLADEIWAHRHPGESVDRSNSEYRSWLNSTPHFLSAAVMAGLGDLDVVFELPTPLGDYIDAALMGKSAEPAEGEAGRLLIVELKQWSGVTQLPGQERVRIAVGGGQTDTRRHPVAQICDYKRHMANNHRGIYKNGHITIDTIAYLHNLKDKTPLFTGPYAVWSGYADKVFAQGGHDRLVRYLQKTFSPENDPEMPDIVDECGYVMDKAGFEGLQTVLEGKENAAMIKDQMAVVDCVREHLQKQKDHPHREIIVISGGPGTGKTIVGMHLIYDYAEIFHNGENAVGSVFCLPRSKTVKIMIDSVCGTDVVSFLDGSGRFRDQDFVVVDEAHRITGLDATLSQVFARNARLLVLLQDDRQRIRPGEDGTFAGIADYAKRHGVEFTRLRLTIQKRCESLGELLNGLDKMFYNAGAFCGGSIRSVRVFDRLRDMDAWTERLAHSSRAKLIAPFCWEWHGGNVTITEEGFNKPWNPEEDGQPAWYYGADRADRVACIYTCQGLDFDDVGFIWWDDLVWDEKENRWRANFDRSRDGRFVFDVKKARLSPEEIDTLFINTYYVLLSRARNKMGIWFKDPATRRHVTQVLGLKTYDPADVDFNGADDRGTVFIGPLRKPAGKARRAGTVTHVDHARRFAYIKGDDGSDYAVSSNTYARVNAPASVLVKGTRVSFTAGISATGRKYANNIQSE